MTTENLDPQVLETLHKITAKGIHELSEPDKDFLRARADYLTEWEKETFSEVLSDGVAEEPTNAQLREQLVALGVNEDEIKRMNHDDLKALLAEKEAKE